MTDLSPRRQVGGEGADPGQSVGGQEPGCGLACIRRSDR